MKTKQKQQSLQQQQQQSTVKEQPSRIIEIGREIPEAWNVNYHPFRSDNGSVPSYTKSKQKEHSIDPDHFYTTPSTEKGGIIFGRDESGPTDSTREESFSDDEPDSPFPLNHIEPEKSITEHILSVVCQSVPWVGRAVTKARTTVSDVIQMESCSGGYYYHGCDPTPMTSNNSTDAQSPTMIEEEEDIKTKFSRLLKSKTLHDRINKGGVVEDGGGGDDEHPNRNLWVLTGNCEPLGCVQANENKPMYTTNKVPPTSSSAAKGKVELKKIPTGTETTHNNRSSTQRSKESNASQHLIGFDDHDDDDNDTHALAMAEAVADAVKAEQMNHSSSSAANKNTATFMENNNNNTWANTDFWSPNASFFANKISALSSGLVDYPNPPVAVAAVVGDDDMSEQKPPPVHSINIAEERTYTFERSVSELTMKSSHAQAISQISQIRRMAYYAVGKHVKNTDLDQRRGGNRRCYFTGKLVIGGKPFYAGTLDQGMKTLVVFCLPSALGLPTMKELKMAGASPVTLKHIEHKMYSQKSRTSSTRNVDEDLSDQDSVFEVSTDLLIQALPRPSQKLLGQIERKYPTPYAALPVIVRKPQCWGLYTKFCFFSGLPIADGEMYYRVREDVATLIPQRAYYGIDEVILSYEVLEIANGPQSAEILKLPSSKTFKYLQTHYIQQCSKLSTAVFDRNSWEKIMPEI